MLPCHGKLRSARPVGLKPPRDGSPRAAALGRGCAAQFAEAGAVPGGGGSAAGGSAAAGCVSGVRAAVASSRASLSMTARLWRRHSVRRGMGR